jgi:anti-anti-sigma regulatory factor
MIEIEKRDGSVFMVLSTESTIIDVEEDADRVRALFSGTGRFEKMVIDAGKVERIDTAYLQLLLSTAASAYGTDTRFILKQGSPAVKQLLKLYGLSLNAGEGDA